MTDANSPCLEEELHVLESEEPVARIDLRQPLDLVDRPTGIGRSRFIGLAESRLSGYGAFHRFDLGVGVAGGQVFERTSERAAVDQALLPGLPVFRGLVAEALVHVRVGRRHALDHGVEERSGECTILALLRVAGRHVGQRLVLVGGIGHEAHPLHQRAAEALRPPPVSRPV